MHSSRSYRAWTEPAAPCTLLCPKGVKWRHHLLTHKLTILQSTMPRSLRCTRMVGCSVRSRNSSSGAVRCDERDSGSSTAQICHSHSLSKDLASHF